MGTKIATLRTAFIKYLVMLIGGLALSVITPFLIFTIFASLGIVNYANQSEEFVKTIAPVLASTPDLADVTENMPPGCDYLLLDKSYTILETSLKNDDVKSALRYATDGVNTANNGKQFLLITRDKELIVLQYYIGSRFINPWLNKYFPSPEMILYSLIALNCVFVCILLTIRFSRRLQKQLVPIMNATEEISSQNLDFEIGHSNIKEFEDVLLSFSKMRDDLKMSLEKQWHAEQLQREQIATLAHEGTGFTSEAMHHAQEQFFMGDKSRTSNMHFGMGLYITNSIIKQHDGQLILSNSKKTGGAQVIIKIPY